MEASPIQQLRLKQDNQIKKIKCLTFPPFFSRKVNLFDSETKTRFLIDFKYFIKINNSFN